MSGPIIIHSDDYANWVFDEHHPTQGRRFINGFHSVMMNLHDKNRWNFTPPLQLLPRLATVAELRLAHTDDYITQVTKRHECYEWDGQRPDLAELAQRFVGGTLIALEMLLDGHTTFAVHLPGAKHHAQADQSSGFCVFADFAIAAKIANDAGERVAILDVDAHHGDGTENLLYENRDILTFSVHQLGIFPGTGLSDIAEHNVYNHPLDAGSDDWHLYQGVKRFLTLCEEFKPTIIFVAGGADGLHNDPLTGLKYTISGMEDALGRVRHQYPHIPILMGGAGGYQPDGGTPLAWGAMAGALS